MRKKIILLCDFQIITEGLLSIFHNSSHFDCIETASSFQQAAKMMSHYDADVLLADPRLLLDLETLPQEMVVVALVTRYVEQSFLLNFSGVVELSDTSKKIEETLLNALNVSLGDEPLLQNDYELSSREREVLVCLAKGKTNKEIADNLFISIHTVMSHRKNIIAKTGIHSVAGLTVYALVNKMIDEKDII